ncbi:MAG: helix-hairpin-helix domain-containing protein, partial [Planctomycetaceae bacterium]|nr:helix-hairpin-helix domain-containing protein [Planctomycetaceae bacterium]
FRSVKDLLRVKGIGPKKLEMMKPFLREPSEQETPAKARP